MKKRLLLIGILFCSISSLAQSKNFLDIPYLETSARVDTLVIPDRIFLNITITEKESKGRKSVEEQENRMAKSFKGLGIDIEKQLVIKNLGSNFKDYFLRKNQVLKRKQYTLLVYSGQEAGEALVALEKLNIANTYLEKTEFSKIKELELRLKSKAVKKAHTKAKALTEPLGQQVGPAVHIVDNSQSYIPRYNLRTQKVAAYGTEAAVEQQPLDIDFEKIKVETSVNVKFKLVE